MASSTSPDATATTPAAPAGTAAEVRTRRERLRRAMAHLEATLARPVGGDPTAWHDEIRRSVLDLGLAVADHTRETEAEDGLLASIVADAPRLVNRVRRLQAEHDALATACTRLAERLAEDDEDDVDRVREEGVSLLTVLAHHRQVGSDLLYEAYNIDVGAGD